MSAAKILKKIIKEAIQEENTELRKELNDVKRLLIKVLTENVVGSTNSNETKTKFEVGRSKVKKAGNILSSILEETENSMSENDVSGLTSDDDNNEITMINESQSAPKLKKTVISNPLLNVLKQTAQSMNSVDRAGIGNIGN